MTNTLIFIWGFAALLGLSSVAALVWAVSTGQLDASQEGATSIFDHDEPIGKVTDSFPEHLCEGQDAVRAIQQQDEKLGNEF